MWDSEYPGKYQQGSLVDIGSNRSKLLAIWNKLHIRYSLIQNMNHTMDHKLHKSYNSYPESNHLGMRLHN